MAIPSRVRRISALSARIASRSSGFRHDSRSSRSSIDGASAMIRWKASVVTQKPAGTRRPSIRESSPGARPCRRRPRPASGRSPGNPTRSSPSAPSLVRSLKNVAASHRTPIPHPAQGMDPERVAADAPFRLLGQLDLGDAVDRPQVRKVVFLEHHSTRSQPLYGRLDVFDLPRHLSVHLSVISCGGAGRLEERELPLTTAVEQTSGPLFARFETQLLCVERPGPLQILYRDPRRDLAVFNHSHRPPSIGLP